MAKGLKENLKNYYEKSKEILKKPIKISKAQINAGLGFLAFMTGFIPSTAKLNANEVTWTPANPITGERLPVFNPETEYGPGLDVNGILHVSDKIMDAESTVWGSMYNTIKHWSDDNKYNLTKKQINSKVAEIINNNQIKTIYKLIDGKKVLTTVDDVKSCCTYIQYWGDMTDVIKFVNNGDMTGVINIVNGEEPSKGNSKKSIQGLEKALFRIDTEYDALHNFYFAEKFDKKKQGDADSLVSTTTNNLGFSYLAHNNTGDPRIRFYGDLNLTEIKGAENQNKLTTLVTLGSWIFNEDNGGNMGARISEDETKIYAGGKVGFGSGENSDKTGVITGEINGSIGTTLNLDKILGSIGGKFYWQPTDGIEVLSQYKRDIPYDPYSSKPINKLSILGKFGKKLKLLLGLGVEYNPLLPGDKTWKNVTYGQTATNTDITYFVGGSFPVGDDIVEAGVEFKEGSKEPWDVPKNGSVNVQLKYFVGSKK